MRSLLSYKINQYITLKLIRDSTEIYINNEHFRQCKFLIINIPLDKIKNYDQIDSIDEAADIEGKSIESYKAKINPETEFWGHCSNLQVWAENNYDTRLLHRTIAFPLLRELTEVGDPVAKRVFKDEIATRFINGNYAVITYLLKEGYLDFFNSEELDALINDFDFTQIQWKDNFEYIKFLKNLVNIGSTNAQRIYNDYLVHIFLNEELKKDSRIFGYLKELSAKRLTEALDQLDFNKYKSDLWILKSIASLNTKKGKEILKEEITKRIQAKDLSEIGLILANEHHFLSFFTRVELKALFDEFDYNFILSLDNDRGLRLFANVLSIFKQKKLPNYDSLKNQFISELKSRILKASFNDLTIFLHTHYIDYLTNEEFIKLIDQYDFNRILPNETQKLLPILKECADKGSDVAQTLFFQELKKRFLTGNSDEVNFIYNKYFNLLPKAEIRSLFENISLIKLDLKLLKEFANLGYKNAINAYKEKLKKEHHLQEVETLKKTIVQNVQQHAIQTSYQWLSKELNKEYPSWPFNLLISQDIEEISRQIFTNFEFKRNFITIFQNEIPFPLPYKFIGLFLNKGSKSAIRFFNYTVCQRLKEALLPEIAFLGKQDYINYLNKEAVNLFNLGNDHIFSIISKAYFIDKEYALVLITLKRMAQKGDSSASFILRKLIQQLYDKDNHLRKFLQKEGYVKIIENEMNIIIPDENSQVSDKKVNNERYTAFLKSIHIKKPKKNQKKRNIDPKRFKTLDRFF